MESRESIIINNFCWISKIDIDISNFNIIVGPQASWKSITIKLLYFFREAIRNMPLYISVISRSVYSGTINGIYINDFKDIFPEHTWWDSEFKIVYKYLYNNKEIKIDLSRKWKKTDNLNINFDENFNNFIKNSISDLSILLKNNIKKDFDQVFPYILDIEKKMSLVYWNNIFNRNIFIPAWRYLFSILDKQSFKLSRSEQKLEYFIAEFFNIYKNILDNHKTFKIYDNLQKDLESLVNKIISWKYLYDKNKEFICMVNWNRKIDILYSSSWQQEAVPLITTLLYILKEESTKWKKNDILTWVNLYIEEPEAHLFPLAQKNIIEFVALVQNILWLWKINLFITTHSPYILTSINTLILAWDLYKRSDIDKSELKNIVPNNSTIDFNYVKWYGIINWESISIVDNDSRLLDTQFIESVSYEIEWIFNNLLELVYNQDNNDNL